jgi:hypothetical protein|tara:strand:- start:3133 stop:3312 length:180 start_codon:yes stop_codon:yes gene_type:complete
MDIESIKSAQYHSEFGRNINIIVTTNDGRLLWVPIDNANTDYKAVLTWVDAGNTITAAD